MSPIERLQLVANRLVHDRERLRDTVLDVADNFLAATVDLGPFPEALHPELSELRDEVEAVKPRFASHRKTSVLFEGYGQAGRERARSIADRIVAVSRML